MIRKLAGRSYAISKRYALAKMKGSGPPVVVFSMGKTGSTALARAVHDATGDRVFQVFRLDAERLSGAEQRYRVRNRASRRRGRDPGALPFPGALHLWESEYLLRHPPSPSAPWTVITSVREPIAQAVSAFFHGRGLRGPASDLPTVETVIREIVDDGWIHTPLRWFDREFAPALGIDVFEHPFDIDRAHGVIETPAVRVLLIRQENLATVPDALGVPGSGAAGAGARSQRGHDEGLRRVVPGLPRPRPLPGERARRRVPVSLRAPFLCRW